MRQVFVDTETTGLAPEGGDRVVEIGCVEMVDRRLTGRTLHVYLNPERPNSAEALLVHGLSDAFLADKPRFAEVAGELLDFVAGAELVIHNAAFDLAFLNEELRRAGRPGLQGCVARIEDSLALARETYPGKANSLDALCRRLEVDNGGRTLHGALLDAGLLAEVYIRMTRGQESLVIENMLDAAGAIAIAQIDLSVYALPVVDATPDEFEAHEAVLAAIDKASGGRTLWRSHMP